MIYPGIGVSLDSLTARASQLGGIGIEAPEHIIGKNTVECMKSGIIYSSAAAIDGIIDRLQDELEGGGHRDCDRRTCEEDCAAL